MQDSFHLADLELTSRLLLGSGGYPNRQLLLDALAAGDPAFVTVSIRRLDLSGDDESLLEQLAGRYRLLPNTSGCETVRDAVLTAELAREALGTDWIKLELIGDRESLYPDVEQLVEAAGILVGNGFKVLPYCNDDPVVCRRLEDAGCAAVMPLGAPIGSGMGVQNPAMLAHICRRAGVPVILDAGIGTASDAVLALELGCAAVLANSAVAKAEDPVAMAASLRAAVTAGCLARRAGRMAARPQAEWSSPRLGLIGAA